MKPKISLITLGVADIQKSLEFYRDGLGFPGITLTYNTGSKHAVDTIFALAVTCGVKPDGHLWEIAWNCFTNLT